MKAQAWVVVANGSLARIFAGSSSHPLTEINTFSHPATRTHGRDLISTKPGRAFDSVGGGRHSVGAELTPQRNEAEHFAETLAHHLEHSRTIGDYTKLYLIVSPAFLGYLRAVLHAPLKELIALQIDKDATSKTPEEIRAYLPKLL